MKKDAGLACAMFCTIQSQYSINDNQLTVNRAMQSERICVLVGEDETPFLVPRELLAWCSPVFKAMVQGPFKEHTEGVIRLRDIDEDTFAAFFLWLHQFDCFECHETVDRGLAHGLAIFAERYQIERLSNEALDRTTYPKHRYPVPKFVKEIYDSTPAGSALRRYAFKRVATSFLRYHNRNDEARHKFRDEYKEAFESCPDFTADFADVVVFKTIKNEEEKACFYHTHSGDAEPSKDTGICSHAKRHALEGFKEDELKYNQDMIWREYQVVKEARQIQQGGLQSGKADASKDEKKHHEGSETKRAERGRKERGRGSQQEKRGGLYDTK